jgi:GTP-binding protein HflX
MDDGSDKKRTVLIWITRDKDLVPEMLELCSSAGYEVVAEIGQRKMEPDPRYYMGTGKIQEIGSMDFEHIVTASDLTPAQLFNISSVTGRSVSDRTRVILDLFQKRAFSPEARMQVEIADLRYQLPVLREYIHQGKLSERPGFMAGGEYRIDYYYDMIRKRITHLKRKLEGERRRRGRKRALRRRRGSHLVSIAGYTNAGKSTLLNRMIETDREDKLAEVGGTMFTTISTTTRKMKGDRGCLISDTVGFIKDLPPWLVEGFMSTLEEIFEADIVLLVLDASEDQASIQKKLRDSLSILQRGGTEGKIITVPNKLDIFGWEDGDLNELVQGSIPSGFEERIGPTVPVSASVGTGIDELISTINSVLPPLITLDIHLPFSSQTENITAQLKQHSVELSENFEDGGVHIVCSLDERWAGHYRKRIQKTGGTVRMIDQADPD